MDANVLEEPGNPPGGAVLGGLLRGHEGHPVVDEDVHGVLAVEEEQEGHQALQVPASHQLPDAQKPGQLGEEYFDFTIKEMNQQMKNTCLKILPARREVLLVLP